MSGFLTRWLCLVCASLLLAGCQEKPAAEKTRLSYVQVEEALKSPEIHSINDLFARLRDTPTKNAQPVYGDLKYIGNWSSTFDHYIEVMYTSASNPKVTEAMALKKIKAEMNWTAPNPDTTKIAKVYFITADHPTKLQEMINWGGPVGIDVFVDGKGVIVGWNNSSKSKGE